MLTSTRRSTPLAILVIAVAALAPSGPLAAQSLEGSKWTIDQEGRDSSVLWWLGSQGRVRTGDIGTILPAYKWNQVGDSVIITVGDTVRYAGVLMSNRLVGVRTGPHRQEGWWSGARADGPTAVAATPPAPPPAGPVTQPMSRPVNAATPPATISASPTPSTSTIQPADGGGHEIRRIGGGHGLRRIERSDATAGGESDLAATPVIPTATLVGKWVRADSGGLLEEFEAKDDGTILLILRSGGKRTGSWSNGAEGTRVVMTGPNGGEGTFRLWLEGAEVRLVLLTPNGARRTWNFRRRG